MPKIARHFVKWLKNGAEILTHWLTALWIISCTNNSDWVGQYSNLDVLKLPTNSAVRYLDLDMEERDAKSVLLTSQEYYRKMKDLKNAASSSRKKKQSPVLYLGEGAVQNPATAHYPDSAKYMYFKHEALCLEQQLNFEVYMVLYTIHVLCTTTATEVSIILYCLW